MTTKICPQDGLTATQIDCFENCPKVHTCWAESPHHHTVDIQANLIIITKQDETIMFETSDISQDDRMNIIHALSMEE